MIVHREALYVSEDGYDKRFTFLFSSLSVKRPIKQSAAYAYHVDVGCSVR